MIAQILVADDNPDVISFFNVYLTGKNHRVILAADGFQLVQKAQEYRPHMIISDIMMPSAYGSSAYEVLQKDPWTASIPVLFISAHSLEELGSLLPKNPKTRFLRKPVALPDLDRAIAELLPMGGYVP